MKFKLNTKEKAAINIPLQGAAPIKIFILQCWPTVGGAILTQWQHDLIDIQ